MKAWIGFRQASCLDRTKASAARFRSPAHQRIVLKCHSERSEDKCVGNVFGRAKCARRGRTTDGATLSRQIPRAARDDTSKQSRSASPFAGEGYGIIRRS